MTDICCIGHITLDRIVTPSMTAHSFGGTSFYVAHALTNLPRIGFKLVTSLAETEMKAVDDIRAKGIDVEVLPSRNTVFFENAYEENFNNRKQRVLGKADPFTCEKLQGVEAKFVHLGSLLADDFSLDVVKMFAGKCVLSVDAQGFLRRVEGEKVFPCDWENKLEWLKYIDILKVNEFEIESLTGEKDLHKAAKILAGWGVKEVVMTLGDYGSLIYAGGSFVDIPAYEPLDLVDATGCGDTYMTGYLYKRAQGASYEEAGKYAAAMSTIKLQHTGPFLGTEADVLAVIAAHESKK